MSVNHRWFCWCRDAWCGKSGWKMKDLLKTVVKNSIYLMLIELTFQSPSSGYSYLKSTLPKTGTFFPMRIFFVPNLSKSVKGWSLGTVNKKWCSTKLLSSAVPLWWSLKFKDKGRSKISFLKGRVHSPKIGGPGKLLPLKTFSCPGSLENPSGAKGLAWVSLTEFFLIACLHYFSSYQT